jgi:putative copper resistance protein D
VTVDWIALVIARWLNFVAVAGLFGMTLFPLYAPDGARRLYLARPASRFLVIGGGVLTLASTFGWAGAALVNMAGDPSALWDTGAWTSFLFETSFGTAWLVRGAIAVAVMLLIWTTQAQSAHAGVAALSAGLLISQAWVGHAASIAQPLRWGVTLSYSFHVVGAGLWFGGLVSLAVVMNCIRLTKALDRQVAEDVLVRFSSVGFVAVLALVVSGMINAFAHRALSLTILFTSSWGQAFVAKVALVAGMLMLAGLNRFVLMPRLSNGQASAIPELLRSIVLEQMLGLSVLAVTAALGVLGPSG